MYHTFETVKDMHVEITTRCNAACPMCARNDFGGKTKEDLELDEWSKDDIDKIFDSSQFRKRNVPVAHMVILCSRAYPMQ